MNIDVDTASGKLKIVVCMGSSCFARGNERNLEVIETFAKRNGLEPLIEISGSLCEGSCGSGPNVRVNGKLIGKCSAASLEELLKKALLVKA